MYRRRLFLCLALGTAVAMGFASCAPVDPSPITSADDPTTPTPRTIDKLGNVKSPTAQSDRLKQRLEAAITQVRQRDLLLTNGFWTVFHGILGMGLSTTLADPVTGEKVNAVDYIASGKELRGLRFIPTKDGLDVQTGPQFVGQGHQDQYIAEMGQWDMPPDKRFVVNGQEYTFLDFVNYSRMHASTKQNQELSWAIVVIGQYMGMDLTWTNRHGEKLTYEDMIRYETEANIEEAACGGTHRLFGLTWAYHMHLKKGGKTEGAWVDVKARLDKYKQLARKWQNPDGSFSTSFFRGTGNSPEMQLRLNSSGHIFEWLALVLTDEELREPWVQEAANSIALMFLDIQNSPMEGGTLYHAIHGLLIYYARVYDPAWLGANEPLIMLPYEGKRDDKSTRR